MIRISKKADYAILLLTHLVRHAARVGTSGGGAASFCGHTPSASGSASNELPVSAQELANAVPIGKPTISNLLKALARAKILTSIRGVHGGYQLARRPDEISLANILHAIDGPVSLVECTDVDRLEDSPCELRTCCSSHQPMQLLQQRIIALLEDLTLDELGSSCPVPNFLQASPLQTSSLQASALQSDPRSTTDHSVSAGRHH